MDRLELFGVAVGLIYLWLEYKASMWVWLTGVVMPAIYIVVYYRAGLYADFAINIYYVMAAVYGLFCWKFGSKRHEELSITRTPKDRAIPLLLAFAISFIFIAELLINYTNSDVPWADSFTTALSIVGMYMLARKYIEQWWVWVVVDAACVVLYVYKGLYPTALLYALYTLIAIAGYYNWKKQVVES